jgi:hypothetical protein
MDFKESDMYAPLKAFFADLGYEVKGEVKGLDMALVKKGGQEESGQLTAVEIKKSFNITLIYQALKRQTAAQGVFVAIPRHAFLRNRGNILHILEKLNMGLITVAMDSPSHFIEAYLLPNMARGRNSKASRALLAEFNGRSFDENIGGGTRTKLITAHKERSIQIACALEKAKVASPVTLIKDMGCPEDTNQILYRNHHGWFAKADKGIYTLSPQGQQALKDPAFTRIVEFYRRENV